MSATPSLPAPPTAPDRPAAQVRSAPVLSAALLAALRSAGLDEANVLDVILRALTEDLPDPRDTARASATGATAQTATAGLSSPAGPPARPAGPAWGVDLAWPEDATSAATVDAALAGSGSVVSRADGVVAGVPVAAAVFEILLGSAVQVTPLVADGDRVAPGTEVLRASGPVRGLLTAERTALNLLCHLSGVATATRRWVDAIAGTGAAVRDTRKTLPGLRALEKYAVRCGGGRNHRMSLTDAALVKDNHVIAAGGVAAAFSAVRARFPHLPVEVECDTVDQVAEAVGAGADLILCDNMSLGDLRAAVAVARPAGVLLEASGGLTLDVAAAVASTGVDFLAVGGLTHSAPALDLGFDLSVAAAVAAAPRNHGTDGAWTAD